MFEMTGVGDEDGHQRARDDMGVPGPGGETALH